MALLVKLGDPVDWTLCPIDPEAQVQVTFPPTATVSTAGLCVVLWLLVKTIPGPTVTFAVVGIAGASVAVSLNVSGDPSRPSAVAVTVTGPSAPPIVTVTAEIPASSVGTLGADVVAPVAAQATFTPGTPLPN